MIRQPKKFNGHLRFHSSPVRGFSLVEMLVALVAGLVLAGGVMELFLTTRQTYQVVDQMSRMQENGRHALSILTRELRMPGSFGCASQITNSVVNTLNNKGLIYYNFAMPVQGFEAARTSPGSSYAITSAYPEPSTSVNDWVPLLPADLANDMLGKVIPGSDVLVIRGRKGPSVNLASIDLVNKPNSIGLQTMPSNFKVGTIAMVADCAITRIFQVTGINGTTLTHDAASSGSSGNVCGNWNVRVGPSNCMLHNFAAVNSAGSTAPSEVSEVATSVFFIGRRTKSSADPNPGPSLYRIAGSITNTGDDDHGDDDDDHGVSGTEVEEVVEGVENMQILYGIADSDGNLQYLPASALSSDPAVTPNWLNTTVVSIKIGLLMRSPDEPASLKDNHVFDVNGTTIDPYSDKRVRKVMTATVAIRTQLN